MNGMIIVIGTAFIASVYFFQDYFYQEENKELTARNIVTDITKIIITTLISYLSLRFYQNIINKESDNEENSNNSLNSTETNTDGEGEIPSVFIDTLQE